MSVAFFLSFLLTLESLDAMNEINLVLQLYLKITYKQFIIKIS